MLRSEAMTAAALIAHEEKNNQQHVRDQNDQDNTRKRKPSQPVSTVGNGDRVKTKVATRRQRTTHAHAHEKTTHASKDIVR